MALNSKPSRNCQTQVLFLYVKISFLNSTFECCLHFSTRKTVYLQTEAGTENKQNITLEWYIYTGVITLSSSVYLENKDTWWIKLILKSQLGISRVVGKREEGVRIGKRHKKCRPSPFILKLNNASAVWQQCAMTWAGCWLWNSSLFCHWHACVLKTVILTLTLHMQYIMDERHPECCLKSIASTTKEGQTVSCA